MRLTPRQQRFVDEYAVKRNGAAAARAAGYAYSSAKVTASRLLTKANVKGALQAHERGVRRSLATSREQVLVELQNAIDAARVMNLPMAMIAGWREVGRICGFYNKREATPAEKVSPAGRRLLADIRALSDEELVVLAGKDSDPAERS